MQLQPGPTGFPQGLANELRVNPFALVRLFGLVDRHDFRGRLRAGHYVRGNRDQGEDRRIMEFSAEGLAILPRRGHASEVAPFFLSSSRAFESRLVGQDQSD